MLTKTAGDPENDGLLEAREIMNMHLNADLAVLSACETANGRIPPGEGVIGMSWAFFVGGTRSMLVSQWKVNSASTSQLMMNFYENLPSKEDHQANKKAQALREAALRLMKNKRYRHPFYWAGFVMIGDGFSKYPSRAECKARKILLRTNVCRTAPSAILQIRTSPSAPPAPDFDCPGGNLTVNTDCH